MITCDAVADRMPDVAHGRAAWTDDEAQHMASCAGCTVEWRLVTAGARLGRLAVLDVDAVATAVVQRLRTPDVRAAGPRTRWSDVVIGLAAAASIAFVFVWRADDGRAPAPTPAVARVAALLPELNALTEPELEQVLTVIEASVIDEGAGVTSPRMGDLTDDELEQLLRSVEG